MHFTNTNFTSGHKPHFDEIVQTLVSYIVFFESIANNFVREHACIFYALGFVHSAFPDSPREACSLVKAILDKSSLYSIVVQRRKSNTALLRVLDDNTGRAQGELNKAE